VGMGVAPQGCVYVAQWEHVWLVQIGVIFSSEECSLVRMGLAT
jgi:hypothetical protein